MNATFITQRQFDDIDTCLSVMAQLSFSVNKFIMRLPWQLRRGALTAIPQTVHDGPPTRDLWVDHSASEDYLSVNKYLDSLLYMTGHVIAGVGALSSADMKSPVSKLPNLVPPPKPPVFPTTPSADCLQILGVRKLGLLAALYKTRYTNANYGYVREGIYKVLPRVIDFTSQLLQTAETMPLYPGQREDLHFRAAVYPRYYSFGMTGMANLVAQQDRISTLLEKATRYVDPYRTDKSLARFRSDLEIAEVYLRQARHYGGEIAALLKR